MRRLKFLLGILLLVLLSACSETSSSFHEDVSSSSYELPDISEESPIVFDRFALQQTIRGVLFSGRILIDEEDLPKEEKTNLDSIWVNVQKLADDFNEDVLNRQLDLDSAYSFSLNQVEIDFDSLEGCGDFRVRLWVFASNPYESFVALDSLDFSKDESFCEDIEPESSSSVEELTECTEMVGDTVVLSSMAGGENRYINLSTGKTSSNSEDMQMGLFVLGEAVLIDVVSPSAEIGEEDGSNFRMGTIRGGIVCLETVGIYEDSRGTSAELNQNAGFVLEDGDSLYPFLVGKISMSENEAEVTLYYWH